MRPPRFSEKGTREMTLKLSSARVAWSTWTASLYIPGSCGAVKTGDTACAPPSTGVKTPFAPFGASGTTALPGVRVVK